MLKCVIHGRGGKRLTAVFCVTFHEVTAIFQHEGQVTWHLGITAVADTSFDTFDFADVCEPSCSKARLQFDVVYYFIVWALGVGVKLGGIVYKRLDC